MDKLLMKACPRCGHHFGGMAPFEKATQTRICVKCCLVAPLSPIGIEMKERANRKRELHKLRRFHEQLKKNKREGL